MTRLWLVLLFVLALAAPALAGEADDAFQRGVAAYKAGDAATALAEFRTAAELGTPVAQFNLGLLYATGQGTPKDEAQAAKWWRKAAENGLADAQNNLGLQYENGRGVAQDHAEAVRLYRAAALQEKPQAQHNLGAMYANGRGIERDLVRAYMWFDLAVARHAPGSARDESIKAREVVATQLTKAERKKAEKLVRGWTPNHEIASAGAKPEPADAAAKARIAAAQAVLRKLGYDPGPADGVEGPRTRMAIKKFQHDVELPETGRLTDDVDKRLSALATVQDSTASRR
jgi:hypothetical protein